eukprot:UN27419
MSATSPRDLTKDAIYGFPYRKLKALVICCGLKLPDVCTMANLYKVLKKNSEWKIENDKNVLYVNNQRTEISMSKLEEVETEDRDKRPSKLVQSQLEEVEKGNKSRLNERSDLSLKRVLVKRSPSDDGGGNYNMDDEKQREETHFI